MKEKLLALLVSKFAGVSEATLDRIATKKAGSVTDESQLQSIVDSIDFGFVVQSEVDSKVTLANQKAVKNYEETHKLKDGKPISSEPPKPDDDPKDLKTIVANAIAAAINPLQQKIETYEKKEKQSVLSKKVIDKLYEGKSDKQKFILDMIVSNGITIESEDQLEEVITNYTTKFNDQYQKAVNSGVVIDVPGSPVAGKEGEGYAKAIAEKRNTNSSDGVKGKEI
jgi:hypothetical protein